MNYKKSIFTQYLILLLLSFALPNNSMAQEAIDAENKEVIAEVIPQVSEKEIFLKNLAKTTAKIEEDRKDIASSQSRINLIITERNRVFEEIKREIPQIEIKISNKNSSDPQLLKTTYDKTVLYWRVLVDNSLDFFAEKNDINIAKPETLTDKINIPEEFKDEELSKKYISTYQSLSFEYEAFLESKKEFIELTKGLQSKLLLKIGKKRSELFNIIVEENPTALKHDDRYFEDLIRELKLIPYRPLMFFYSKILSYQELTYQGISGIISISSQIFFLLFSIAILIAGTAFLKKATHILEMFRENLVRKSFHDRKHRKLSLLVTKLVPYFPWIFLIAIFDSIYIFIEHTALPEISAILPYFIYYFLYRIARIIISSYLNKVFSYGFSDAKSSTHLHSKIKKTSKVLGVYLLTLSCSIHLTQTIVRKALVYDLVLNIFILGLIAILAYLSSKWQKEISNKFSENFSQESHQKIANFLLNKSSLLFSLPLVLLITLKHILNKLFAFFSNNDFSKRILAQIYRKRLETAAKKIEDTQYSQQLSEDYIKIFDSTEEDFMEIAAHPYQSVKNTIDSWLIGKNKENSMVIYGESGIGKTTLLNWVDKEFSKVSSELKIIRINFTQKIFTKKDLIDSISKSLNLTSLESSIEKIIENYPDKTLVIIDNCENLFLSKKGGFAAFKLFADLVNISSSNLFWLTSFHRYSWNYLFNALDHSNYFRYQFKLPRWKDTDIKDLILNKHAKSELKLVYDSLIFAMQSQNSAEELQNIQEKFFQMLWSQSRGNPKTAINLWISALRVVNKSTLKITLPQTHKFSDLIKLSDEQLFVFAAIAKHHYLSTSEIISVTNLQKGAVLNVVRFGIERGYLIQLENRRYRLSDAWKILISGLLINKNFIYE